MKTLLKITGIVAIVFALAAPIAMDATSTAPTTNASPSVGCVWNFGC